MESYIDYSSCSSCHLFWSFWVQDVNIDEEVDVIISEWMGYMLLYEVISQLTVVILERDLYKYSESLWDASVMWLVPQLVPCPVANASFSSIVNFSFHLQSMLSSVITARDRWLKPGGIILPSHATVMLVSEN